MQMQDLAKVYKTKTDEELLQLASDSEQLTPEAHAILRSELAVRRIDVPKHLTAQEESDQGRSEQPRTRGTPFIRDSHAVRGFVAESRPCVSRSVLVIHKADCPSCRVQLHRSRYGS